MARRTGLRMVSGLGRVVCRVGVLLFWGFFWGEYGFLLQMWGGVLGFGVAGFGVFWEWVVGHLVLFSFFVCYLFGFVVISQISVVWGFY